MEKCTLENVIEETGKTRDMSFNIIRQLHAASDDLIHVKRMPFTDLEGGFKLYSLKIMRSYLAYFALLTNIYYAPTMKTFKFMPPL